jgi:hypothetical protein
VILPCPACIRNGPCNIICKHVCNVDGNHVGGEEVMEMSSKFEIQPGRSVPADRLGAVAWRKSRASGAGNCVELAPLGEGAVAVRHSLDPHGPALIYTSAEIAAFVAGARNGEFDDLVG